MINSVYVHIPFCSSICSYCDFSKFFYNKEWVNNYLTELEKEIKLKYKNDIINTIYIGGGTPSSLTLDELNKLFEIIKIFKLSNNVEFTFECNIENITKEKLELLFNNGVNRLSIGIQTFNDKYLKYLNRHHTKEEAINKINMAKNIGFNNINIDLIYAIPGQTIKELSEDLDIFLSLNIEHISTYSLIIEPNTWLYVHKTNNTDEDLDYEMYKLICKKLKSHGYNHYEISNFSKEGYCSKHNLTYWNNLEYYGFGIGASGYINGNRYDNTKSFNNYISGKYLLESHALNKNETIENEFILGLRKTNGIDIVKFKEKYDIDITKINNVKELIKAKKLILKNNNLYINPRYIYVSNDILINFIEENYQ